jgi:mannose-1-phosphate guanylyltransferase
MHEVAAIILAGGDGTRLRSLTRRLVGDDRPKQFCSIVGHRTLLDQTRTRATALAAPAHTLVVVTRAHESWYTPALAGVPRDNVVVQPAGRGTATAVLYALARQARIAPARAVALLPSDHWVSDDAGFMARVEAAVESVHAQPGAVVLLGIEPEQAETGYGWIEPGDLRLGHGGWPIYDVRRFWEKPPRAAAEALMRRGALWNSFVTVANPAVLMHLIQRTLPGISAVFASLVDRMGTPWEDEAARAVYTVLPAADLSKDVLERAPERLAVLPVTGVGWSDLGVPERVLAVAGDATAAVAV